MATVASRLRFLGRTPDTARRFLEDLGLAGFVAIVGLDAGTAAFARLTPDLALGIIAAGFLVGTVPPVLAWLVGYHVLKMNPVVLVGAIAGTREQPGPARALARETSSTVPWIGFPVASAISSALLAACGYLAMILSR